MPKGRISEPRNKNLLKMINLIGIGEHAGSGVPDIYDVWESEGLDTPVILEQFGADQPDRTTMILPLVTTNISESDRKKQSEKTIGKSNRKKQSEKAAEYRNLIIDSLKIEALMPMIKAL